MTTLRIKKSEKDALYFCTLTVHKWYYVFDRHNRFEMLEKNLKYCQKHKGLSIFAYVFMLNHIHIIASAPDLIGVLRDFKSFTSKEFSKNICAFEPHILKLFETEKGFRFWQPGNEPKIIETEKFLQQKYDYILENPVKTGYVRFPEHWKWSSANPVQKQLFISDEFGEETNAFNRDD